MREFTVGKNDAGQRADKFLQKACPALPKSAMYKYIRKKSIKCNGKRLDIAQKLCEGDVITMYINDEFFAKADSPMSFAAAGDRLEIVYEDENILLLDKPVGLVVHEDESGTPDTLINRVLKYLNGKGEFDPAAELSFTPALCNRIDRNTQGIVICAKTAEALRVMNQKIKDRELSKKYLCITVGIPSKKEDTLRDYCFKDERTKTVTVSAKKLDGYKTMVTKYRVLAEDRNNGLALVEVDLITGRTHQIRAHMAHIGCPLLGDGKYGINRVNRTYNIKTQALCSHSLTFGFTTDAGSLGYLNGKNFTVGDVWFVKKFFPDQRL
ncbi:23S rRNA pseudouridine955/2504/2580 synthase [Ruminococcus sp. YE71]|uniref:RluA family pseudouridine synthase n=1 Tax=unclassified Ruminococcus TaxID=2608920 RepID=UPI00087ED540|nr:MULTISPECIES: RluA family pseudouridine synthase [unclassified Ruminococcus]SDA17658.1 23S rRNA pseudouridine955/2504/2580 synthase [Ruminococcus sp. YE78]SFW27162.1 23S rRNA pseudouridine955/2504/2580 synthase [Ruminococcus sp. YE71]